MNNMKKRAKTEFEIANTLSTKHLMLGKRVPVASKEVPVASRGVGVASEDVPVASKEVLIGYVSAAKDSQRPSLSGQTATSFRRPCAVKSCANDRTLKGTL